MGVRLEQFDRLKGIGIILVMLGHALPSTGAIHNLIYGFHMPLFFFCSGFFFRDIPLKDGIKRDIKSLLVPWSFFCLVLVVCSLVLKRWSNGSGPIFHPLDENCWVFYYTIWFLICLFLVRLFYRLIARIPKKWLVNLIACFSYIGGYALRRFGIDIPFFLDSSLSMLLFYHLGVLYKQNLWYEKRIPIWGSLVLIAMYAGFVLLVGPQVNIKANEYPIYLIVLSIIPIIALYQICCIIKSKIFLMCGTASLTILGLHHPIYDVVMFPLMNRFQLPNFVEITLMLVITLGIVLLTDMVIRKYFPYLLGRF